MIVCCYTQIDHQWTEQELTNKLASLPEPLQVEALQKKQWIDRQLSVAGKLLVLEVIRRLGYDELSLSDLKYNEFHRPYFDAPVDFNIAHSGNIVVCCGTDKGEIGIDIEQIKEIDINEYQGHFTKNEWNKVNGDQNTTQAFYELWVRKEAILKAIGTGLSIPLQDIDVSEDTVGYKGIF